MGKKDRHSYKGWLNSDSFLKRALAITGYGIVGTLLLYGLIIGFFIAVLIVILILTIVFG